MDGRFEVDDGQGLGVAQQQQQKVDGYPIQQYQSPAQAHWDGSSAQPTNAPISQSSQPFYGYSPIFADSSYSQHARRTLCLSPLRLSPLRLSPLHPHSGPLAVVLKIKSNITIQGRCLLTATATVHLAHPCDKDPPGRHPRWIL